MIDALARRIVGWRVARSMRAGLVLDALEQALHDRRPVEDAGRVHRSAGGSRYLSIRHTERLGEAGIASSVGSVGDSCDNALAETVTGLCKTEVIRRRGPRHNLQAVEFVTLSGPTGSPPVDFWSRSETFCPPRPSGATVPGPWTPRWRRDPNQTACGRPAGVQPVWRNRSGQSCNHGWRPQTGTALSEAENVILRPKTRWSAMKV